MSVSVNLDNNDKIYKESKRSINVPDFESGLRSSNFCCISSTVGYLVYDRKNGIVYDLFSYFAMTHFLKIHVNVFLLSVNSASESLVSMIPKIKSFECMKKQP